LRDFVGVPNNLSAVVALYENAFDFFVWKFGTDGRAGRTADKEIRIHIAVFQKLTGAVYRVSQTCANVAEDLSASVNCVLDLQLLSCWYAHVVGAFP